jgi:WD40 repeat protein
VDSGDQLLSLRGHEGGVLSVALSGDGRRALSGSLDGTLRLWDLDSGAQLLCLRGDSGRVNSVALSGDGRRALSVSWHSTVRLWDLDSGQCLALFPHDYTIRSVAMTPCPPFIVYAGDTEGNVLFFRIEEPDER